MCRNASNCACGPSSPVAVGALMHAGRNGSTSSTAGTGTGSALSTISNGSRMTRNIARRLFDDSEAGAGRRVTSPGRFISVPSILDTSGTPAPTNGSAGETVISPDVV